MTSTILSKINEQTRFLGNLSKNRNFWIILIIDALLIIAAHYLSYVIRFEGEIGDWEEKIINLLPIILTIKLPIFYFCGLYRGMWRYTSMVDMFNIAFACVTSTIFIVFYLLYSESFHGYSRSVFLIDSILTFLFVSINRTSMRFISHSNRKYLSNGVSSDLPWIKGKKRILLIGAGDAGEKIIREIKDNKKLPYTIVGLVDDDIDKIGLRIHGIPVIGALNDLREQSRRLRVDEILLTISSATGEQMKRIVKLCQSSGVNYKVLPGLDKIIDGRVSIASMRKVSYSDLLGREEVKLDVARIGFYITGKTILVTGAGGSIGSELCRQIIKFSPDKILLLDASEENLYSIQMELIYKYSFEKCVTLLGQIQSAELLNNIFKEHSPTVVFHAAAYKHVPLLEQNSWEAIINNVFATKQLIEKAIENNVERFVIVSTDKAVRPTSIMGASKRITELLMLGYGTDEDCQTVFQAVRFGNVLGSSGSVIPLFIKQIEMGGPVTVTHPDITRFFMSVEEAAQLILQAGGMGTGNEIFILKMGDPIKIDSMARELIRLSGKEPDLEIRIKYIGLREGEKLYEELISEGEGIVETDHNQIMVLKSDSVNKRKILRFVDLLIKNAKSHNQNNIKKIILRLVPEYRANGED